MSVPGYWMDETSGVLRPVVEAYLEGNDLTPEQCAILRAYLRQWINNGAWMGVDDMRIRVEHLNTRQDIDRWLDDAIDFGLDPF